ncbi:hypothetical protein [Noviherbaspirillum saxi]|uniref:hypothetical protein n=1 Tax=Noviherbaspirillum saxi TaxID=2320863 RepID=UPI0011C38CE1|nr:hypothetical protein [Noviherbaspirillum saxi]
MLNEFPALVTFSAIAVMRLVLLAKAPLSSNAAIGNPARGRGQVYAKNLEPGILRKQQPARPGHHSLKDTWDRRRSFCRALWHGVGRT